MYAVARAGGGPRVPRAAQQEHVQGAANTRSEQAVLPSSTSSQSLPRGTPLPPGTWAADPRTPQRAGLSATLDHCVLERFSGWRRTLAWRASIRSTVVTSMAGLLKLRTTSTGCCSKSGCAGLAHAASTSNCLFVNPARPHYSGIGLAPTEWVVQWGVDWPTPGPFGISCFSNMQTVVIVASTPLTPSHAGMLKRYQPGSVARSRMLRL